MSHDLAVIIPAYKEAYFYHALQSLARQTNKGFTVYIGDDCSPFALKKIVDQFSDDLDIVYKRFSFNIGSRDLVNQWKRCISLSSTEKWLWLFSDDDIADKNCVARLFETLDKEGDRFDVYRFNTCVIDSNGVVMYEPVIGPDEESSEEMAYNLLLTKRGNSMPDHIFSRKIYDESGGFIFTKYAQSADWAASILFSKEKGMHVIQDVNVFWRLSGQNLSSVSRANRKEMIHGYLSFLTWLQKHFEYLDYKKDPKITRQMIKSASWLNFKNLMLHHYKGFDIADFHVLVLFLHNHFNMPFIKAFRELFHIKMTLTIFAARKRLSSIKRSLLRKKKLISI